MMKNEVNIQKYNVPTDAKICHFKTQRDTLLQNS